MRTAVVSYSYTGNNNKLAAALAAALGAEHIAVVPDEPVTMNNIALDMLFGRTPAVKPDPAALLQYDRVVLLAPAWMGKAAAPIRAYLKQLKKRPMPYAFVTLSGGSLNPNPRLPHDIAKRAGARPFAFETRYITDLLPKDPKPTPQQTSEFRLSDAQAAEMAGSIAKTIQAKA
jgi:hypothetical protein